MSDKIVPFPTKAVRDWIGVERQIDELLANIGLLPEAKLRIKERLKTFNDMLAVTFDLSGSMTIHGPVSPAQQRACSR